MLFGNHRLQIRHIVTDSLGGHNHINTEGLIAELRLYPVQLLFQLLRGKTRRPKYTDTAGLGYFYDHIPTVGKSKNGYIYTYALTNFGFHFFSKNTFSFLCHPRAALNN